MDKEEDCDWESEKITQAEVQNVICALHAYKATGPDEVHNLMLKRGGNPVVQSLEFLFNYSLRIGHMPKMEEVEHITDPKARKGSLQHIWL